MNLQNASTPSNITQTVECESEVYVTNQFANAMSSTFGSLTSLSWSELCPLPPQPHFQYLLHWYCIWFGTFLVYLSVALSMPWVVHFCLSKALLVPCFLYLSVFLRINKVSETKHTEWHVQNRNWKYMSCGSDSDVETFEGGVCREAFATIQHAYKQ